MSNLQIKCDFMLNVVRTAIFENITLDEFQKLAIAAYGILQPTPGNCEHHGQIIESGCLDCEVALDERLSWVE